MSEFAPHLVEIGSYFGDGYRPVLDFEGWRVAMLRYGHGLKPSGFHRVERHRDTNEVFILTAGQADLIVCDGDAVPTDPAVVSMTLNVAYNIQRSVWHHVVMSADAHIVLVERTDTGAANSDYAELAPDMISMISAQFTVE